MVIGKNILILKYRKINYFKFIIERSIKIKRVLNQTKNPFNMQGQYYIILFYCQKIIKHNMFSWSIFTNLYIKIQYHNILILYLLK